MKCSHLLKYTSLLVPALGLAHGESKPGPHGGEIRMPGTFHVEVVANEEALDVYLLDMNFKHPQVADYKVRAVIERDGDRFTLECLVAKGEKMFRCLLPSDEKLDAGSLVVDATRGGLPAVPMQFELPLKWDAATPTSE